MSLPVDDLRDLLLPGGSFSKHSSNFEHRSGQIEMLEKVCEAFLSEKVALIEAGTGIGKSLAYLIPSVYFAVANGEKVVISTNTISLQEQLLYKDIPQIEQVLGWEFQATLVKGMGNYLCKRRLGEAAQELTLFSGEEEEDLDKIREWENATTKGCLSDVPFTPKAASWDKVKVEMDTCLFQKCPHYDACYYFKARKEAEQSQIIIVNHHLLFADLAIKKQLGDSLGKKGGLLPPYSRLVIDEAHNLEDVATEYFASNVLKSQIRKQVGRLSTKGKKGDGGKFALLEAQLQKLAEKRNSEELRAACQEIRIKSSSFRESTFNSLKDFFVLVQNVSFQLGLTSESSRYRFLEKHLQDKLWKEKLLPKGNELSSDLCQWGLFFQSLFNHLKEELDPFQLEKIEGLLHDINAICNRLTDMGETLSNILREGIDEKAIRFFETRAKDDEALWDAFLDISERLSEDLFSKLSTTILCSATLTTSGHFDFFKKRNGLVPELLGEKEVQETLLPSPFDYENQALIGACVDLPNPNSPEFFDEANKVIYHALLASRGNAFVLFTSYKMMNRSFDKLSPHLKKQGFTPLKQGERSRSKLLGQFQKEEGTILFGTDSFWEGVDVVGDALRLVILVKLPFKVPNEPIVEGRCELIEKEGKSSFIEYVVPNAIVKFKQGFGRLIRHKKDKGCILCLDSRLTSKGYGKAFLKSLPTCNVVSGKSSEILEQIQAFYGKLAKC